MRTEDGELIHQCLNGDSQAFSFLVDKYRGSVYGLAYSKIGDIRDAEEIAQDVFVKAYQKLSTLKRWDRFAAWLYAITSNYCKDWLKTRAIQPIQESLETQPVASLAQQSLRSYGHDQLQDSIRDALAELPAIHRHVLTLYYLGGQSSKEIARFLGISTNTVNQRLFRARAKLRDEMCASLGATFEQSKLQPAFTFRVIQEIQPRANPLARLPWAFPVVAGALLSLLVFGPQFAQRRGTNGSSMRASAWGEIPVSLMASASSATANPRADSSHPLKNRSVAQAQMSAAKPHQRDSRSGTLVNQATQFTNRQKLAHSRNPGSECLAVAIFRIHVSVDDSPYHQHLFGETNPWSEAEAAEADDSGTEMAEWIHRRYPMADVTVLLDERINLYPGRRCWGFNGWGEWPVIGGILKSVLGDSPARPSVLQFLEDGKPQYRGCAVNRGGKRTVEYRQTWPETLDEALNTHNLNPGAHAICRIRQPFSVHGHFARELDQRNLSAELFSEFRKNHMPLGTNAVISVTEPGQQWLITQGRDRFGIQRDGGRLHITPSWRELQMVGVNMSRGPMDRGSYYEVMRVIKPSPEYVTLRPGEVLDLSRPPIMTVE